VYDGSFSDPYVIGEAGAFLKAAVVVWLELLEDELVCLEEVLGFACVLPPALDLLDIDPSSCVEEGLDGVRDLQFASPRGLDVFEGFVDLVVEDVDADEGPVADGLLGLLDEDVFAFFYGKLDIEI